MAKQGDVILQHLQEERARLQNAADHLQRSNAELKEAIAHEGDPDREYKMAIEENIVVIAKYKARIVSLEEEEAQLRRGMREAGGGVAVPLEEERTRSGPRQGDVDMVEAERGGDGSTGGAPTGSGDGGGVYL